MNLTDVEHMMLNMVWGKTSAKEKPRGKTFDEHR